MLNYIETHRDFIRGYIQPDISWRNTANGGVHANIIAASAISNDFALFEQTLNEPVGRSTIANYFKEGKMYEGFMATMLWGHKHRAKKASAKREFLSIVSVPKDEVVKKMDDVKQKIDSGQFKEAFDSVHQSNKIKYVGESFYTKILYYLTYHNPQPLLILDVNMHSVWCALRIAQGDVSYKTDYKWDSTKKKMSKILKYNDNNWDTYLEYLQTMYSITPKDAKPDELEAFLFRNEPLPNGEISPRQFVMDYIDMHF